MYVYNITYLNIIVNVFEGYDKYIDDFANYSFSSHGLCIVYLHE